MLTHSCLRWASVRTGSFTLVFKRVLITCDVIRGGANVGWRGKCDATSLSLGSLRRLEREREREGWGGGLSKRHLHSRK